MACIDITYGDAFLPGAYGNELAIGRLGNGVYKFASLGTGKDEITRGAIPHGYQLVAGGGNPCSIR